MRPLGAHLGLGVALALTCPVLDAQRILTTVVGTAAADGLGAAVTGCGDLDGDGVVDFAVGATPGTSQLNPYVHFCSGRDGSVLRTLTTRVTGEEWGAAIADIGDVTGDGVRDVAIGVPSRLVGVLFGAVELYSGRDGALIATVMETTPLPGGLGHRLLGVDDVDADGTPDFVATAPSGPGTGGGHVRVYSGRTRALLRAITFGSRRNDRTTSVALAGDFDRDGVREIVAGDAEASTAAGRVAVFDLRTGATVRTVAGRAQPQAGLGFVVAGLGDVDRDGVPDFAATAQTESNLLGVARTGAVFAWSGRTGNVLWALYGTRTDGAFGASLSNLGDLDGDSADDLAIGTGEFAGSLGSGQGQIVFVSGASGAQLMRMEGLRPFGRFGKVCAGIGDVDRDGFRDLLVGAPAESAPLGSQGVARVISGRILADASIEGIGCGGGPFIPLLGGTRPLVGTTAHLAGEWAPPVPGFLLLSPPPAAPMNLGVPACHAYVDLARAVVLAHIAPGTGRWSLPLPVPGLPGFPGLELSFQVIYGPTLGPLGFDVTGGLRWRIGW